MFLFGAHASDFAGHANAFDEDLHLRIAHAEWTDFFKGGNGIDGEFARVPVKVGRRGVIEIYED